MDLPTSKERRLFLFLFSIIMRQTGNGAITNSSTYAAFISYAHADERTAKRLHEALETYPLPKDMRSWDVEAKYRARLKPVFRDVAELTAHHSLTEKIREAVRTSRFLIVLCSPAARKSRWVNEEIRLFRKLHGEAAILAVIVEGKPNTAFPPALTEAGREPLAADISGKEGFRFGVTQLAASMLGVGLDRLVQRDQRRRRLRAQAVSAISTALALIMGGLAWTAIDARDLAEVSQEKAEVSRNAAEEMVEFMIKDLKDDLVPIQKLELFDNVGKRVTDYYDTIPLEDMDDDRLMRQARSLHVLGEVELNRGDYDKAETEFQAAYDASKKVYHNNPDNTDAIFTHAQSEYWIGWKHYLLGNYIAAIPRFENYMNLSQELFNSDPKNYEWVMEAGWGNGNFALANLRLGNLDLAEKTYRESITHFKSATILNPEASSAKIELANIYSGMAQLKKKQGKQNLKIEFYDKSVQIYKSMTQEDPSNNDWRFLFIQANYKLLREKNPQICPHAELANSLRAIYELTIYDPENFEWRKEHLKQWKYALLNCNIRNIENHPSLSESNFLRVAEAFSNDSYVRSMIADMLK